MKKLFVICCLSALVPTNTSHAADPAAEIGEIRKEVGELRLFIDELNQRLAALESRLSSTEDREQRTLPWQREQPFLWDGMQLRRQPPIPSFRKLDRRDNRIELPPHPFRPRD